MDIGGLMLEPYVLAGIGPRQDRFYEQSVASAIVDEETWAVVGQTGAGVRFGLVHIHGRWLGVFGEWVPSVRLINLTPDRNRAGVIGTIDHRLTVGAVVSTW